MKLSKTNIIIIIYFLGLIFGAIFLDLWSSDTNIKKGLIALTWTAVFLIFLFYADRDKE